MQQRHLSSKHLLPPLTSTSQHPALEAARYILPEVLPDIPADTSYAGIPSVNATPLPPHRTATKRSTSSSTSRSPSNHNPSMLHPRRVMPRRRMSGNMAAVASSCGTFLRLCRKAKQTSFHTIKLRARHAPS